MDENPEVLQQLGTVMLVDDNENWRYLSKRILQKAGVGKQIITADNGLEAIKKLQTLLVSREKMPDLIFLDINMPVMDGFEVLEEITKWPELDLNQTRIFLCTTSTHVSDKEKASQYPIARYITKSLTQQILGNILQK
jgi:CheY-like chemotaxis protein